MADPDTGTLSVPLKRTTLFECHQRAGAKLIDFGGWEMPVYYSSIVDEHHCVRRSSGIFDISHMGEVRVSGAKAVEYLNRLLTQDIRRLEVGQAQYTLMCRDTGGVVDDLYAYRLGENDYLLIINASRIEVDVAWILDCQSRWGFVDGLDIRNESEIWAAMALQGPRVIEFMGTLVSGPARAGRLVDSVLDLKKNEAGAWTWASEILWVARTGYTGEDGFEVVLPAHLAPSFWQKALDLGHVGCIQPCGLGARDTLRTEMGYPLYGHELDETTTPVEAGLGFFVGWDKPDFCGKEVLIRQKAEGVTRKCVAIRLEPKSPPPRPGYRLLKDGCEVGRLVSGTQSPSLSCGIGLGYVAPELARPETELSVEIRGKTFPARVCRKPLYRP